VISPDSVSIGLGVGTQPPLSRIKMTTRLARSFGFDAIWTVDHLQGWFPQQLWNRDMTWMAGAGTTPHAYFDYQSLVGYLAERAGRLHVGVGVTEALRRHPVLLAQTAMTWSHLARSSPILGIGAGERENTVPYGIDFDHPVGRLEEALQIIRRCFDSRGPFGFSGKFFVLDKAMMDLSPAPGRRPQIWVAAHGPRMLRLTGQYGDGWYPTFPMQPGIYGESLAKIREAARSSGRDPKSIVPGHQLVAVIGRTESEARKLLDTQIMRFLTLLAPAQLWAANDLEHPLGPNFRGIIDFIPAEHPADEILAAMAKVPIDVVAENVLWGTPERIRHSLEEQVDAGLRHIVVSPASAAVSRRNAAHSMRALISILRRVRRSANARLGER
jgi:phthiodiolone/phenolphthiodiolone dimycocerosates ketoreductase